MLFKSGLKMSGLHLVWAEWSSSAARKPVQCYSEQLTHPVLAFISLALNQCPKDKPCSQDWEVDLSHFWEPSPLLKQPVDYTWPIWCLSAMTEGVLLILWSQTLQGKFTVLPREVKWTNPDGFIPGCSNMNLVLGCGLSQVLSTWSVSPGSLTHWGKYK